MSTNKQVMKGMTDILRNAYYTPSDQIPNYVATKKIKDVLTEKYGAGGIRHDLLYLPDYLIDLIILHMEIDISPFSLEDVNSVEFDGLIDIFVLCIGKFIGEYEQIIGCSKDQLIPIVMKNFTLDVSEI